MFNKDSGIVKVWVNLINKQKYGVKDVPELSNLKDVVLSILNPNA